MSKRGSDRFANGGDFCSGFNCQNARCKISCNGLPFFKLPTKDGPRCKQWLQNMRRDDLLKMTLPELVKASIKVCAIHFEDSQFTVPNERKRLIWNGVPTIFDVPNPPKRLATKRPLRERLLEPPQKKQHIDTASDDLQIQNEPDEPATPVADSTDKKLKAMRNQLYRSRDHLRKVESILTNMSLFLSQRLRTEFQISSQRQHQTSSECN